MRLQLGIIAIFFTFFGCNEDKYDNYAYLGGQIINPRTDFVVLSKNEKILDTVRLDGYNRFIYKIDSLEDGIYTFKHGDEFQMVLLEQKDSVMLRLNTLDFDESLVYTGEGAKKNNYFTNEFLNNEIEEKKIFKYCQLDPETYEKRIESIRIKKIDELEAFKTKYETSGYFNKVAQANIDYNYYFNKEIYPFIHYGKNKQTILASIPEDFYSYRKEVNYNDDMLKDYFTYKSFLRTHINNLGLDRHLKHNNEDCLSDFSFCYTVDRLDVIDSLVTNESIKNGLLYHYAINALARCKTEECTNTIISSYLEKSADKENNVKVRGYAESINNLKPGSTLPQLMVSNFFGTKEEVDDIINNNTTVITFWSHTSINHLMESHGEIKKLKVKYPEVHFISINIDDYDLQTTKQTLQRNNITLENEYLFNKPSVAKETLAIYALTKTLILDKNKQIVASNANIFDRYFEEELLGAINR